MGQIRRQAHHTMTVTEWREWAATATRNYTDRPIGGTTADRRSNDALNSAIVTEHDSIWPSGQKRRPARGATIPSEAPVCPSEPRNGVSGPNATPESQEAM